MSPSLASQILHGDHEIDCPECGYPVWIRLSEVVAQCTVTCPCCRLRLHLLDGGQMQNLGDTLERQIDRAFEGLTR
ncbi:hypothetical protein [Micromonospora sp. NPDC023633]|uniref:hypothetical protein n=1 Tax=Micromonospora sp. NPDC023633 TaxID=3154320 RepID=UPI00340C3911